MVDTEEFRAELETLVAQWNEVRRDGSVGEDAFEENRMLIEDLIDDRESGNTIGTLEQNAVNIRAFLVALENIISMSKLYVARPLSTQLT